MKNEIYIMLTKGSDEQFCIGGVFKTFEEAEKAMKEHNDSQIALECGEESFSYIDEHRFEMLLIPGFVINPKDIMRHTTLTISNGSQVSKTDRYIIKQTL